MNVSSRNLYAHALERFGRRRASCQVRSISVVHAGVTEPSGESIAASGWSSSSPVVPPPPQPAATAKTANQARMFALYRPYSRREHFPRGVGPAHPGGRYAASVPELRNVIVFAIGAARYAVELRWVREVVTLGLRDGGSDCAIRSRRGVQSARNDSASARRRRIARISRPARPASGRRRAGARSRRHGLCGLRVDQVDHVASLLETAARSSMRPGGRSRCSIRSA